MSLEIRRGMVAISPARTVNAPQILIATGDDNGSLTTSSTAGEAEVISHTIPAGTIQVGDILAIETYVTCTDNANVKRNYIDMGSTRLLTATLTNQSQFRWRCTYSWNTATSGSAFDTTNTFGVGSDSNAVTTHTEDINSDIVLSVRHQFASAADSMTTHHYMAVLYKKHP